MINLPRPQVLPTIPISLDIGVASTIPKKTKLINAIVVVTAEFRSAVLVPIVLVTPLDFVPDCAAPGFVEVKFGDNTAFEPSNQPMSAITAWLSRTVTETLPFDPIGMVVMVELTVFGVPSLLNSSLMPFQVVPLGESAPSAVR